MRKTFLFKVAAIAFVLLFPAMNVMRRFFSKLQR